MSMNTLTWHEATTRRMQRHGLIEPAGETHTRPATIAATVAAMCGAHAQVMSAAELSIGLRLAGITRQDVRHALWEEHSLVKTFGPRGTVHLLPTEELPLWTAALAALPAGHDPLPEEARLTAEQKQAVVEAIAEALEDAELTVDELGEEVVARTGPWAGDLVVPAWYEHWPRWRPVLHEAARQGVLSYGPNRGRTVTYTNPRRWLPEWPAVEGQDALAWLLKRYLYAYGPATPQQFAQWLATSKSWATELFKTLSAGLEQVELEGAPAWVVAGDTAAPAEPFQGVRLLPYFDAFVVGCHPRELLFPGRAAERALGGGQAGPYPVLLIDGVVAGVWHQKRSGRKLHITVEPLDPLSPMQQQELEAQVTRIGEILEGKPQWTIGEVKVGPHA